MKVHIFFVSFLISLTLLPTPAWAVDILVSSEKSFYSPDISVHRKMITTQSTKMGRLNRHDVTLAPDAFTDFDLSDPGFLNRLIATLQHRGNLRQIREHFRHDGVPENQIPAYAPYKNSREEENSILKIDPVTKALTFRLWTKSSEGAESAIQTAIGLLRSVHKYGAYDHDLLMSELSGLNVKSIRQARRMLREKNEVIFRYFHDQADADEAVPHYYRNSPFKEAYNQSRNHVEGVISEDTGGHVPVYLPGESLVMHRMAVESQSLIGKYNPGLVNFYLQDFLVQKWAEYLFWSEFSPNAMPKTINLGQVVKGKIRGHISDLRKKLDEVFPNGWIIKPVFGFGSEKQLITNDIDIKGEIDSYLNSDFDKHYDDVEAEFGKSGNYEHKIWALSQHPHFMGWKLYNELYDVTAHQLIAQARVNIVREFRIEVWGGEILPGTTIDRYAYKAELEGDDSIKAPSRSQKLAAEKFANSLLKSLPKELRETPFALDIAELADGSHVLIESNPGGNSSFLYNEPSATESIVAIGKFLEEYPDRLKRGDFTEGLSLKKQKQLIQTFFAKWKMNPEDHFSGVKFLDTRVELDYYPKRKLNPKRWKIPHRKFTKNCARLLSA